MKFTICTDVHKLLCGDWHVVVHVGPTLLFFVVVEIVVKIINALYNVDVHGSFISKYVDKGGFLD